MKLNKFAYIITAALAASMLPVFGADAASPALAEGTYSIRSCPDNNMAAEIADGSLRAGATLVLGEADGSEKQLFNITKNGGGYTITSVSSGLAIGVTGAEGKLGEAIVQDAFTDSRSQKWSFENTETGAVYIKSAMGTLMGSADGSADSGAALVTARNKASKAQWWRLVKEEDTPRTNAVYFGAEIDDSGLLASAAMMIRTQLYLNSDMSWQRVNERAVKDAAVNSTGAMLQSWKFTSANGSNITLSRRNSVGTSSNLLKTTLDLHPEGMLVYIGALDRAVLITDYIGDDFYCADPAEGVCGKRIKLSESSLADGSGGQTMIIKKITAYWTVSHYTAPKAD